MARFVLFCMGFYYIEEVYPDGKAYLGYLRRGDAPRIIVSNHCSFVEAIYFGARSASRACAATAFARAGRRASPPPRRGRAAACWTAHSGCTR